MRRMSLDCWCAVSVVMGVTSWQAAMIAAVMCGVGTPLLHHCEMTARPPGVQQTCYQHSSLHRLQKQFRALQAARRVQP